MGRFILRKLLYGLLVLWGVVTLVFAIFSINPGDPARMLLGQRVDEEALEAVNKELGLDLPIVHQYILYLNDISPISVHNIQDEDSRVYLDSQKYRALAKIPLGSTAIVLKQPYLRRSYQSRKPVSEIISEALPGTGLLAVVAICFALVVGVTIGVITALYKDSFIDKFALFTAVLGMSTPSFFSAIIISWLGGYLWAETMSLPMLPIVGFLIFTLITWLGMRPKALIKAFSAGLKGMLVGLGIHTLVWLLFGISSGEMGSFLFISFPGTGLDMTGSMYGVDVFEGKYLALNNLILPVITLGIRPLAVVVQLTRNSMLDVLSQDYIRTARAKGLSQSRIVIKHALRNAMNPVITAVSGWFASMLAGAVFIEFVFNWKGLGLQVFQSLQTDDYPVVMGSVLVIAAIFVIINIFVDILYGWLDPRIRIK